MTQVASNVPIGESMHVMAASKAYGLVQLPSRTVSALALVAVSLVVFLRPSLSQEYIQDDYLNSHNAAREEVGVDPLSWDEDLASYAQSYADERANDNCALKHSNGPYGENLFWGSSTYYTASDAVDSWVAEKKNYDYESNSCTSVCGHYTQVVWADTKSVGCGSATCSDDEGVIFVCSYDPPGNYDGEWPYQTSA